MYEDRRETFSIKDVVLQLLFIVLLVFILIWLFPTKGYLEKKLDGIEAGIDEKLKPLYTRLFTDNIITMKDAAKSYYTTPRLPQEVGDKVTMTLGEMYEKGLLLELVDSNNNSCDATKSYIELTKAEDEYLLKVTLSCSDKEAYIIEHLGCYDYCNGRLCTKEENEIERTKTENPTPVSKKYRYEYVLNTSGQCGSFGSWGEWTSNVIEENSTTKVQTKTEKEVDYYKKEYKVVDTQYKDVEYYDDVYYGYSTRTIKKTTTYDYTTKTTTTVVGYGTKTYEATATYDYVYGTVTTGTTGGSATWVASGTTTSESPLASTSTTRYTETGRETKLACEINPCVTKTIYYYNVEKLVTSGGTPVTTTTKSCPTGTVENAAKTGCVATSTRTEKYCPVGTDNGSGCAVVNTEKYCPTGTTENAAKTGCETVTYEKQNYCALNGTNTGSGCVVKVKKTKKVAELVYGWVEGEAVYKNVTYYRSATRSCSSSSVDYKWSESNNDSSLKSQGYTLTGKTEEI